jgi:hypothetical protein
VRIRVLENVDVEERARVRDLPVLASGEVTELVGLPILGSDTIVSVDAHALATQPATLASLTAVQVGKMT